MTRTGITNSYKELFIVEQPITVLKIDGRKYVLSHFPMADWQSMSHESIHLHGHIHSEGVFIMR